MDQNDNSLDRDQALRLKGHDEVEFGRDFRHQVAVVGDVRIHYVIGGSGSLVVLLHGFPQHCRESRFVMPPLLDAAHTILVPDLRGFGSSDKPLEGFDVATVADDVRQLVQQLQPKHEKIRLVGHDVGAAVAYAWAAAHQFEVERLALIEGLPAGLEPPSAGMPMLRGKLCGIWPLA